MNTPRSFALLVVAALSLPVPGLHGGVRQRVLESPSPLETALFSDCGTGIQHHDPSQEIRVDNAQGAGEGVAIDSAGNTLLTGSFRGSASDFDPLGSSPSIASALGGQDGVIAKYDTSGQLVWKRTFGGTGNDSGKGVAVDAAGSVYVVGHFEGAAVFDTVLWVPLGLVSAGGSDAFAAKYDASGNLVWFRQFGGSGHDVAHDVAVDGQGNVYFTGYFSGSADFDPGSGTRWLLSRGSTDAFLCRLDPSGNLTWVRQVGGTSTDVGLGIALSGNHVLACGYHRSPSITAGAFTLGNAGGSDAFLVSYEAASGSELNARGYGGASDDAAYDIASDAFRRIYLTGSYRKQASFGALSTVSGGRAAGLDTPEAFVLKLDSRLDPLWLASTRQQGSGTDSTGMTEAYGIAVNSTGCHVYVTGRYVGGVDFDPGTGTDWQGEGVNGYCPNYRAFLWSLDTDGNHRWTESFGDSGTNSGNSVAVRGTRQLSSTGYWDTRSSCSSAFNGDLFLRRK